MFIKKSFLLILSCVLFTHGAYAESCDAGYYDNNGVCEQCSGNTFSDAGASECIPCEENTFADNDHKECVTCNAGNYMNDGICTTCPAGSYCTGNGTAVECSQGTYSDTSASECIECPLGYTTDKFGATFCTIMPIKLFFGKDINNQDIVANFPNLTAGKINTKVLRKADKNTNNQNNENN